MLQPVRLDVDLRTRKFLIAFRACSIVEDLDRSREQPRFPALSWVAVPVGTCDGKGGEQEVGHEESTSGAERLGLCSVSRSSRGSSGIPARTDRWIHLRDLGFDASLLPSATRGRNC